MTTPLYFTRTTDLFGPLYYAEDQGLVYTAQNFPGRKGWFGAICAVEDGERLYEVDWTGHGVHIDEMLRHLKGIATSLSEEAVA